MKQASTQNNIFSPPSRESLGEKVVEQLREAIFRGQFAPGEPLRVSQLAEPFGVSMGPIREALGQLEREGLVIMRPNRTAVVARLSPEDFEEIYSLRLALERVAMQYAIRNATSGDLDEMESIVDWMIRRVSEGITEKEAADLEI